MSSGKFDWKWQMKKFKFRKTDTQYPIGLDIGNGAVRALQLQPGPNGKFSVRAAMEHEYPQGCGNWPARLDFLQSILGDVDKNLGFSGRVCRVSLPACFTDVVHLSEEELNRGAGSDADGPFDLHDVCTRQQDDSADQPSGNSTGQKIVMAADRAAVSGVLKMLSQAGLHCQVVSMDISSLMEYYLGALCRRESDKDKTVMFVDLGYSSAQIIVAHGKDMAFARNLKMETSNLWADKLASELVNCLRYHDSMYSARPITEAIFMGGRAHDMAACRQLAEATALPSRVGDPFALIDADPSLSSVDIAGPQWAVCMGLCLAKKLSSRKEAVA